MGDSSEHSSKVKKEDGNHTMTTVSQEVKNESEAREASENARPRSFTSELKTEEISSELDDSGTSQQHSLCSLGVNDGSDDRDTVKETPEDTIVAEAKLHVQYDIDGKAVDAKAESVDGACDGNMSNGYETDNDCDEDYNKIDALKKENDVLRNQVQILIEGREKEKSMFAKLNRNNKDLQKEKETLDKQNADLHEKVRDLEKELEVLDQENESLDESQKGLLKENKILDIENNVLHVKIKGLQREISHLNQEIERLHIELMERLERINLLDRTMHYFHKELGKRKKEIDELIKKNKDLEKRNTLSEEALEVEKDLLESYKDLLERMKESTKGMEQLAKQKKELKERNEQQTQEMKQLEKENKKLQERNEQQGHQMEQLTKDNKKLQNTNIKQFGTFMIILLAVFIYVVCRPFLKSG